MAPQKKFNLNIYQIKLKKHLGDNKLLTNKINKIRMIKHHIKNKVKVIDIVKLYFLSNELFVAIVLLYSSQNSSFLS